MLNVIMNLRTKQFNEEFAIIKPKIFIRDNWECQCEFGNCYGELTVDHIRKRSLGGTNEKTNLITLRSGCHGVYESMDNHTKEKHLRAILHKKYGYQYQENNEVVTVG